MLEGPSHSEDSIVPLVLIATTAAVAATALIGCREVSCLRSYDLLRFTSITTQTKHSLLTITDGDSDEHLLASLIEVAQLAVHQHQRLRALQRILIVR